MSMMEWMVGCGRDLTTAKWVQAEAKAQIAVSPKAGNLREVFKPLLGFL